MAGDLFQLLVRWYQWAVTFPDQTRRASGQTRRNRAVTLLSERRRAGTGTDAVPDLAGRATTDGGGDAVSLRPGPGRADVLLRLTDAMPLIDERLDAFGHDLGDERGRAGNPDAVDQVFRRDVPSRGTLRADRHRPRGQDPRQQVGERCGMRQREVLRAAGQTEPGRLSGEPQGDGNPARDRGRGDREGLITALRIVFACGDLDDERTLGHGRTLARRTRRELSATWSPARRGRGPGFRP